MRAKEIKDWLDDLLIAAEVSRTMAEAQLNSEISAHIVRVFYLAERAHQARGYGHRDALVSELIGASGCNGPEAIGEIGVCLPVLRARSRTPEPAATA